ncbi:SGNH/GDSL hydrolase family protein [Pedobacter sp. SYSU D00535]|uniref:SGNH/GDSL hydrolase family protein n=1 Tax=Pedobacter sp. SYSU D00535 TaxID=2810308 RepID=UPI001A9692B8|nr:SGNH/GDSL hydrolase family protein [Pedobacter sp. SYSU D00535]
MSCKKGDEFIHPKDKEGKIIILGSSTAAGAGASPSDSSWVSLLGKYLQNKSPRMTLVNLAQGGYTSFHIMPSDFVPAQGRPLADPDRNVTKAIALGATLVIINLPSNDIANGYSGKEFGDNLSRVADALRERRIAYIITGTQPRNLSADRRHLLKDLNQDFSHRFGPQLFSYYHLLNTADNLILPQFSAGDGVHLNNAGHRLIFDRLIAFEAFQKFLRTP